MAHSRYKEVQTGLQHFCKMRQFAVPEFLRRFMADGVQKNMPQGIIVHRLNLRVGTLAAIARGSDMVKISLPDLAAQLLGPWISNIVREKIREIFGRAEVADSETILKELEQEYEGMPLLTMSDNVAKQAVLRLKDRMSDLFKGRLPDCPITLEPIPRERVRILQCCTAVLDAESISGCNGRCPLCRAPIAAVGEVAAATAAKAESAASSNANGKRPLKQAKLQHPGSPSLQPEVVLEPPPPPPPNAEQIFEARMAELTSTSPAPYHIDGIMHLLKAQVQMTPSSRVLLCFGFSHGERPLVRRISDRIQLELPGSLVTDIDLVARNPDKMDEVKMKFDSRQHWPHPQVFIVNTTDTSSSVQGLDLHQTDLTIIADICELHTKRQAVGRSLRMQVPPQGVGPEYRFPAKRVVVASVAGIE